MWRITGVPGDREVPAGRSAHRAEHEHPLKLAQRNRVVPGPVGKRPIRDLITEGEAPRAAAEQRLHQWKCIEFTERLDLGTGLPGHGSGLLNAHRAPSRACRAPICKSCALAGARQADGCADHAPPR